MKITQYLKQSWHEAKSKPLYTGLYITGVTLAVALTMIFANYYFIRISPTYPEVNRNDTYYLTQCRMHNIAEDYTNGWYMGSILARDYVQKIKGPECVSIKYGAMKTLKAKPEFKSDITEALNVLENDAKFFKIYEFDFLAGRPFSQEEFDNKNKVAVISDIVAEKLYSDSFENIIGKSIFINDIEYRITGIVKHCSQLCTESYADAYCAIDYDNVREMNDRILGPFTAVFLIRNDKQLDDTKKELENIRNQIAGLYEGWELVIGDQPKSHIRTIMQDIQDSSDEEFSWWKIIRNNMLIVIVLLLVPALNMSGMISGRMENRQSEIGIRKSFGATKSSLLSQLFIENMLYTLIGAFLGLIISWSVLYFNMKQIIVMFDPYALYSISAETEPEVSFGMLFSPEVFFTTIIVIFVFNSLSAIVPAWWALRQNIVNSLNNNR